LQDGNVEFPADPQTALGLVQLAMNCSKLIESASATAAAVAAYTPELAPGEARRLLVTAAIRGHVAAVKALMDTSAVRVHVGPPTFEQVLQHLMAAGSFAATFALLDSRNNLPVVRQLSRASVLNLLQQAVAGGNLNCTGYLIGLPVMGELSCEELMLLLKAAAGSAQTRPSIWVTNLLCGKPAAAKISSNEVAILLQSAAQRRQLLPCDDARIAACMLQLCKLPAAQQLSSQVVTELLTLLLTWSKTKEVAECTAALCRLQAAQQLSHNAVTQLLHTAAGASFEGSDVEPICSLPAAKQINCFAIAALLRPAVQFHDMAPFAGPVCSLPAAHLIKPGVILELLTQAVERCTAQCVLHLSKLPAAQEISSDSVLQLLHLAAAGRGSHAGTGPLCCLAGAQELSAAVIGPLLMKAATQSDSWCVRHIAGQPRAAQLDNNMVERLLLTAVQRGDRRVVEAVCDEMPAVQQVGPGPVVRLLREAAKWGDVSHVTRLQGLLPFDKYRVAVGAEPRGRERSRQQGGCPERRTREYVKDDAPATLRAMRFTLGRWP
jgi:hypothetical protein